MSRLDEVCVDDMFETQDSRTLMDKTYDSNSSTTGFEVNDVAGSKQHSSMKPSYDENDEEVAEVLGK